MTIKKKLNNNSQMDNELVLFANSLADLSESLIAKYFRSSSLEDFEKSDNSPVTLADTEVERVIREAIEAKYPEHAICGEEFEETEGNSPYKWYIDPIDGTSSFITGKPVFTTLIALTYKHEPILGVVNQPILKERWCGGELYPTNFNGKNVKTRGTKNLEDAVFSTTSPYLFSEAGAKQLDKLRANTKYQKYGGLFCGADAYQYAMLATGYIDLIVEEGLKPHDFLALIPVVRSAGGVITDWSGQDITDKSDGRVIASATEALHQKALKILNEV